MTKRIWVLAVIGLLVVALAVPAAFGATHENNQYQQFFNQMFDWHTQWIDQAQKDGRVTPEQAKAWQEHFNYMRDFHSQNGFGPMGQMMMGGGMMGGGMMGGFGGYGMMGGGYSQ